MSNVQTKVWMDQDRTGWGPGPWDREPDRKQWLDPATSLPCLAVRVNGHWCGDVGVPAGHPWYEKHYNDLAPPVEVHGGLTYADFCQGRVCHEVEGGEHDSPWWLGFDCAHYLDNYPTCPLPPFGTGGVYRSLDYVEAQCESLAKQVVEAAAADSRQ